MASGVVYDTYHQTASGDYPVQRNEIAAGDKLTVMAGPKVRTLILLLYSDYSLHTFLHSLISRVIFYQSAALARP